jgi:xylulokinase
MLLGIDIGTTNTKVAVYTKRGKLLTQSRALTPKGKSKDGLVNFLPEKIWTTTARLIKQAVSEADVEIAAMAVSSFGEGGVSLDKNFEPTYDVIPWYDEGRTTGQLEALSKKIDAKRFYTTTGLYPSAIHTIFKWLWLKEERGKAWQKTRHWLSMTDFIGYKLSGTAFMEAGQAARTMAYNVVRGQWSEEILGAAGLDSSFLPPVVPATTPLGGITKEASKLTGLPEGTPVFVGGHDHFCAALACGALSPEVGLASFGTAEAFTVGWRAKANPKKSQGFAVGPHVLGGYSYVLGGIYVSGGVINWLKHLLNLDSFSTLVKLAAKVEPATSPFFIANFRGAAPPFNDPHATGAFLEVKPEHTQAHFARAVIEGIAFEHKASFPYFEKVTGQPMNLIRMVGIHNPLMEDIRAAIFERPVETSAHDDMVTMGVALLAGLGARIYASPEEAIIMTYKVKRTVKPDAKWREAYEAPFERYVKYREALRRSRQPSAISKTLFLADS